MGDTTNQETTLTVEQVKNFLETNADGKQLAQQLADARVQNGIKTFEDKFIKEKLPSLLETEISKRYPAETPEQKKLKELEMKFELIQKEKNKAEVLSKALKHANEKNIPSDFVDELLSDDYDSTISRLDNFSVKFSEAVQKEVENKLSGTGRRPPIPTGDTDTGGLTAEKILKMTPQERAKLDKNVVENIFKQQYSTY